jgi:hypothetical protein
VNHTPSLAQHAFLASIDCETKLAVERAYRACRQLSESHHPRTWQPSKRPDRRGLALRMTRRCRRLY